MPLQILEITAPVFLLGFAGYVWGRMKLEFDHGFITRLALNFSTPCLVFAVLVKVEIDRTAVRDVLLAALVAYGALALMVWAGVKSSGLAIRTYFAPVVFANTGNIGLPVAFFAYGDKGLAFAIVIFALMIILSFTVGIWVTAGTGMLNVLRQPLVYASVLGGVFAFNDWGVPGWLLSSLDQAGQMAIPLMLLTLGVSIANLTVRDIGEAAAISLTKLGASAVVALAVTWVFGLAGAAKGVLILQLIMPAAVTNYLLAERYKTQPGRVAGLVVVSTMVSVAAIPLCLGKLL